MNERYTTPELPKLEHGNHAGYRQVWGSSVVWDALGELLQAEHEARVGRSAPE